MQIRWAETINLIFPTGTRINIKKSDGFRVS